MGFSEELITDVKIADEGTYDVAKAPKGQEFGLEAVRSVTIKAGVTETLDVTLSRAAPGSASPRDR